MSIFSWVMWKLLKTSDCCLVMILRGVVYMTHQIMETATSLVSMTDTLSWKLMLTKTHYTLCYWDDVPTSVEHCWAHKPVKQSWSIQTLLLHPVSVSRLLKALEQLFLLVLGPAAMLSISLSSLSIFFLARYEHYEPISYQPVSNLRQFASCANQNGWGSPTMSRYLLISLGAVPTFPPGIPV